MISTGFIGQQIFTFFVMVIVGMLFNPMNILAYNVNDLYISLTLFYSGLLMASNMIWSHAIIHYFINGHLNTSLFIIGISGSVFVSILLLRKQLCVDDNQWLRRMIGHHSTALTTTHNIYNKTNNPKVKKLAKNIIDAQESELQLMKDML